MSRRSRRRASHRKKPSSRKGGVLLWILGGSLVFVFVAVITATMWVRGYLKSAEFRQLLDEEASEVMQGRVEFGELKWNGLQVSIPKVSAEAREEEVLSLVAENISSEVKLSGVSRGVWEIPLVKMSSLDVTVTERPEGLEDFVIKKPDEAKGFLESLLPEDVEVGSYNVGEFNLQRSGKGYRYALSNAAVEATLDEGGEGYEIDIFGGEIVTHHDWLSEAQLKKMTLKQNGDDIFLNHAEFEFFKKANLTLTGEVNLPANSWSIYGDLGGVDVSEVVNDSWAKSLRGEISSKFSASTYGSSGDFAVEGDFTMDDAVITALPILNTIAAYTNTYRFRRLNLDKCYCHYKKEGDSLFLTDITLNSAGLARLEGDLDLIGDKIDGRLRIGVTPGTLSHIPGAETKVFTAGKDNLLWAPIHITGTLDKPKEDLTKRLILAAGERLFQIVPETGTLALKFGQTAVDDTTKALIRQSVALTDPGKSMLEKGAGLLKEGGDLIEKEIKVAEDLLKQVPGANLLPIPEGLKPSSLLPFGPEPKPKKEDEKKEKP